ncbi:MAG TPA: hypothetical protein DCL77_18395 [Prolixibacteraceae bacterium]|nr:hypothetical protein [Prolixibacteraceae bacterium]
MKDLLIKYAVVSIASLIMIQLLAFLDGLIAARIFYSGNPQSDRLMFQGSLVFCNLILNLVVLAFISKDMARLQVQNKWIKLLTLVSRSSGIMIFLVLSIIQNKQNVQYENE